MIKINGVELPAPTTYKIGIMDISKAERNAAGTMVLDVIATKRKIEMSWKFLTNEQIKTLLQLVSDTFFDVEYLDPVTDALKTGTFYKGDRNLDAVSVVNGNIIYKDIKFNIIER